MVNSHDSLAQWLNYLENRHVQEMQLGLSRIHRVAASLNLLEFDPLIITVAGTNGKGSTVSALESIYLSAGYRVGCYTSPHLLHFNERIRVNQAPIHDEKLCDIFSLIDETPGAKDLTYFEMTTLAALWYFKSLDLDVIILEVGLGGRLDATNIIDADLAMITTIDLDHEQYLGSTKEAISYEKAGILRKNTPYIYADKDQPLSIIERAKQLHSNQLMYQFKAHADCFDMTIESGVKMTLPLPSIHLNAAAAAIAAVSYFHSKLPVTLTQFKHAMRTVSIPGRRQMCHQTGKPTVLFDVAHNPQAVALLAQSIEQCQMTGKIHAVFSGLSDKNLLGLIEPMFQRVDFWYPSVLNSKRAASQSLLKSVFKQMNCEISKCFNDPQEAYEAAKTSANPEDLIVVYGSFLTVSAVMFTQQKETSQ